MSPWGMCGPMPRDWNYRSGRLHHTWLRTVESDSAPLNIGLATAYRLAQNSQVWSTLVEMATSSTRQATRWWFDNLLEWWWKQAVAFLATAKVARQFLSVPAWVVRHIIYGTAFLCHTVTYRIDVFFEILHCIDHLPKMLYPATTNFFPAYSALFQHYIILL